MTLPNRVRPDGRLAADRVRGLLTGNRGVLHDPITRAATGRRWTSRAWIACTLDWQGRRRAVWGGNGRQGRAGWSELFFLDEVTALAAGHRPCFVCRRPEAMAFAQAAGGLTAPAMDRRLHATRWLSCPTPPESIAPAMLPDGVVVEADGRFLACRGGRALPWTPAGYGAPEAMPGGATRAVTPPLALAALRAGYRPLWHPSAA